MLEGLIASILDFDRLPVAAVLVEGDGTVIAVNRAAARLAWIPVAGERVWQGSTQLEAGWQALVAGPDSLDVEVDTVDGKRWARIATAASAHAEKSYVLACIVDISDRVASARIASSQRLESLGLVAGGVAHEFNNQLVSVVSEASMLREDDTLGDELREAAGRIEGAARRMTQLTKQLLAFAGRGRFVTTLLDPDILLADTRSRLTRMVSPTIALQFEPSSFPVAIEADRGLLRQVILDLVENAADACGVSGTIRIASRVTPTTWELEITDDGAGMDVRTLNRIFDPFFSTKADHRGLGLSAVLGIIKRLNGDITVTSQPAQGATFVVRLPIVAGAVPPRRRSTSEQPPMEKLTGLRILVADDEPSVRQTIQRALLRRQAIPVMACDGAEAEELLRTQRFDAVLLDVMMPKKTGYQLVPIARVTQPDTPVILMSGYSEQARGVEPPDAFMEKPFNVSMLEKTIQHALRLESQRHGSNDD